MAPLQCSVLFSRGPLGKSGYLAQHGPRYLEVQASYSRAVTVLVTQMKAGQLYLWGAYKVADNCNYGLVITTLELQGRVLTHTHELPSILMFVSTVLHFWIANLALTSRRKRGVVLDSYAFTSTLGVTGQHL